MRRIRRRGLVGVSVSLRVGFKVSKVQAMPSFSFCLCLSVFVSVSLSHSLSDRALLLSEASFSCEQSLKQRVITHQVLRLEAAK